jgi:4-amino-4-deoxy-L-arabinose transferase-like glycosyltransferase
VLFCISGWFVFSLWIPELRSTGQIIHNWPDAMANQVFSEQFRLETTLRKIIPVHTDSIPVVHPRSVNIVHEQLVPLGFIGFPVIYGLWGKVFGNYGMLFLTPLLGSLGIVLFYYLIKKLFDNSAPALVSAVLLAFFAPWLYYTSMNMLSTVPFLVLFMAALACFIFSKKDRTYLVFKYFSMPHDVLFGVMGGALLGVCLWIRPVELPWMLLWLGYLLYLQEPIRRWKSVLYAFLGVLAVSVPFIMINAHTYGHWYDVGYMNFSSAGAVIDRLPTEFTNGAGNTVLRWLKVLLMPFGLHERAMLTNLWTYFGYFFGPWLIVSLGGLLWYWRSREWNRRVTGYIFVAPATTAWLLFYYGNWIFADGDTLRYNLMGSSYMRYFLPAFVALIPGIGYALWKSGNFFKQQWIRWGIPILGVCFFSVLGMAWAFLPRYDGLLAVHRNVVGYDAAFRVVQQNIEPNAVIVVDRADKIFFPTYLVVVYQFDGLIFSRLPALATERPVYYYTALDDEWIAKINVQLMDFSLELTDPITISPEFRLYKIIKYVR